jgi:hypothetical protein
MSDSQPVNGKDGGPSEMWRELRDAYLDAWAKIMSDTVQSESYAQNSGAMLDACLTASAPFRQAMEKSMVSALEQLNMPSRPDFVSLAERMTNIEMRLDDMDAKLDRIVQALGKPATEVSSPPAKPRRGKKGSK